MDGASLKKGGDILSHRIAVPSAQAGLTTLFGMGRGEPRRNNHLRFLLQAAPVPGICPAPCALRRAIGANKLTYRDKKHHRKDCPAPCGAVRRT